jgi:predicted NBD/HSP70 family sugar kinase
METKNSFIGGLIYFRNKPAIGLVRVQELVRRGNSLSLAKSIYVPCDPKEAFPYLVSLSEILGWAVGGEDFLFFGDKEILSYFFTHAKEDEGMGNTLAELERVLGKEIRFGYLDKEAEDGMNCSPSPFGIRDSGCRIGLDLGGSDLKVVSLIDGKAVYEKEILWSPKEATSLSYHREALASALRLASSCLPEVDSIGVSTTGIVLASSLLSSPLYIGLKGEKEEEKKTLLSSLLSSLFPGVPYRIANDGDVSALFGKVYFRKDNVLGLSLGTGFASGLLVRGGFSGFMMELGKAPIDFRPSAPFHAEMKTKGAGSEVFSQKGLLSLAKKSGIVYPGSLPEQLVSLQEEAGNGNGIVLSCYKELGRELGRSILFYRTLFSFDTIVLLGRVMSGKGGEEILASIRKEISSSGLSAFVPGEEKRRLGQAYVAGLLGE